MSQYKDPRWQKKRLEILSRDNWQCVACFDSESELHVHHIAYHGELWDTPNHLLQTLCVNCHKSLGPHPIGGPYYDVNFSDDQHGHAFYQHFAVVYHHCPICGNDNDDSHSGAVIFKCGHIIEPPEWLNWDYQQSINTHPAYISLMHA